MNDSCLVKFCFSSCLLFIVLIGILLQIALNPPVRDDIFCNEMVSIIVAIKLCHYLIYLYSIYTFDTTVVILMILIDFRWFYITWMVYILPFVSGLTTATFLAMSGVLWYNFLRAWKGDPGVIVATPDVQMKTIVQLAEKGSDKGIEN